MEELPVTPEDSLNAGSATLDANCTNPASSGEELSSFNIKEDEYLEIANVPSALDTSQHTTASSQDLIRSASLDQQLRAGIAHEAFELLVRTSSQRLLPFNMPYKNVRQQDAE